jgi:hypothetical protein
LGQSIIQLFLFVAKIQYLSDFNNTDNLNGVEMEKEFKEFKELKGFEEVKRLVIAGRQAQIDGKTGVEQMKERLFWKLHGWMTRETGDRIVDASEVVDKVVKYAAKAILKSRKDMKDVVCRLWAIDREVDENEVDEELNYIFN